MLPRWPSQQRTAAAAAGLAGAVLTWLVWRSAPSWGRLDGANVNRQRPSVCRSDMEVNTLPPMAHDHNQMINDLFTYLTRPSKRSCRRILRFGGADPVTHGDAHEPIMDGAKHACMDPEFGLLSADDCLVYSFGVGVDWSFDWDMERFGCTVHAFDPSINATAGSQNGSILFLRHGVGGRDGADAGGWPVRTLDSLVRQLGHTGRTIHYLKMDVEADEWDVLRQQTSLARRSVLFRNVEQLAIELHFAHRPLRYRDVYRTLLDLQALGFHPFWYEPNLMVPPAVVIPGLAGKVPSAIEVVWVKTACVGRTGPSGDRSSVS